ncbi:MAG: 3-oxoacyl-[acyl-carrier-protein] synthase III C-terminal domain-containing protein [candidate division Zixibacteria bacterium]|nr:3-oxoacyl-[acyl-carrier-protein] synthase III C-terminal domain-containing protein [candidate division Zixibacteria bacterium]
MPRLCAIETAVPQYAFSQTEISHFAAEHFGSHLGDLEKLMPIFSNAGIATRYFAKPLDWVGRKRTMAESNAAYIETATALSLQAVTAVLEKNNLERNQIDYIIYVNTTGLATPSIDARLINLLNFRRDIRRTPIWGLGCAGGAAGLSHAFHYAQGHPRERILVVSTELCSLTFIPDDHSKSNFVATALFADGSAAALVVGDKVELPGLEMLASRSTFYPDSLDVMGWNIDTRGLQVVFAQRIPDIVAEHAKKDLSQFLDECELRLGDISQFLFHPGGTKVLQAYENALGITNGSLSLSKTILSEYGNMSSCTVLFVIERYLKEYGFGRGGHGLVSALGPGFCSESLLLEL